MEYSYPVNIFILDHSASRAAEMLCDNHVCKMVIESAQMLCGAFPDGTAPYKRAYYHHPCSVWTRACRENYEWHLRHAQSIAHQYEIRYGREHRSAPAIDWCTTMYPLLQLPSLGHMTPFAQAMPDEHRDPNAVVAYRSYYADKRRFARWRRGVVHPSWWPFPNEALTKIQR